MFPIRQHWYLKQNSEQSTSIVTAAVSRQDKEIHRRPGRDCTANFVDMLHLLTN